MHGMGSTRLGARLVLAGAAALALAGCGSSLDPMGGTGPLASVIAFNGAAAPPPIPEVGARPADFDCPHVETFEGKAALRVGGEASSSVRHQFSLGDVARECSLAGNQISIKVGMQGRVLIGPAGGPGTYSTAVRIAVRSEKDQKIIASRSYRPSATIPAGESHADFTVISEPLLVPFTRQQADEDYTVLVGFDGATGTGDVVQRKRKRRQG